MLYLYTAALIISSSLFCNNLAAPETTTHNWKVEPVVKVMYDVKLVNHNTTKPLIQVESEPKGRWVTVIATAYSPKDKIDSNHPHCKDDFTASMTRISKNPYGIAVPMRRDGRGRSTVPVVAEYGSQIYIPSGYGYLDNSRKEDRIFVCDDTGGLINRNTRVTGIPHIDLRFKSEAAAKKFGKKKIEVFIYDE
jgi:3D (Asp-Asp-Asp) domain-containing protein